MSIERSVEVHHERENPFRGYDIVVEAEKVVKNYDAVAEAGWTVKIKPIMPFDMAEPGATAHHEATHTVAAILTGDNVLEATRISGPGYSGRTRLSRFNPIAFVAAHAKGCRGAGYDLMVLTSLGHDINSLAGAARGVLSGHEDKIHAVASLIEARGTISGYEALEVMEAVANPKAEITLINPLGQERSFVSKVRQGGDYFIPVDLAS